MSPLVFAMPGNEAQMRALCRELGAPAGEAVVRRFPDGESHVQVKSDVQGRAVFIVCTLHQPDDKFVPLLLLAEALRDSGAASVSLIAPYLAYMRQDARFHPGETISARHVARWLSGSFDALVTVDPHLHRIANLSEIYSIPTRVVHAADAIAHWLQAEVARPLLVGPDEESQQWVTDVAARIQAPSIVLRKTRRGDHEVEVSVPEVERWMACTPVLVDDIVSTGRTMVETLGHLRRAGLAAPVCVAVHAVFSASALDELRAAGAARVVSCDTIPHASNGISLAAPLGAAVNDLLRGELAARAAPSP